MYAVIKTGGKQYKVAKDDKLEVEKIAGEPGASVTLASVFLLGDGADTTAGTPLIEGASVTAEVVEQKRTKKIIVFKKQRRKNYRRKHGHRQEVTLLKITDIVTGAAKAKAKAKKPKAEAAATEAAVTEAKAEAPAAPQPVETKSED
jgi:large subunit ribosomal protein L21